MGKAGRRLKSPSTKLTPKKLARNNDRSAEGVLDIKNDSRVKDPTPPIINSPIKQANAIKRFASGPAAAILSSLSGSLGISSIADTPPMGKRTILPTLTPYLFAIYEWLNSCTTTVTKSNVIKNAIYTDIIPRKAITYIKSINNKNEMCSSTGIPKALNILNEDFITSLYYYDSIKLIKLYLLKIINLNFK